MGKLSNSGIDYSGRFEKTAETDIYLEEIPLEIAAEFVLQHHYSKVMPKQTKIILGAYKGKNGPLVGVITLGWGVRPKDTIRRLFPSLDSKDYLEIGKLCVHDSEPKNTESRILAVTIKWLKKNRPDLKVLFTWADALWGKPGYIYQAANFYYGGFIWTDIYADKNMVRFHPRQLPAKLRSEGIEPNSPEHRKVWGAKNGIGSCRPKKRQLAERGWKHYFGMQFRYVYFLTDKLKESLLAESAEAKTISYAHGSHGYGRATEIVSKTINKPSIIWRRPEKKGENIYPKFDSIKWRVDDGIEKDGKPSKPIFCGKPEFGAAFDPNRISIPRIKRGK